MDEELDKIVILAKASFEATQKAKAAYDAYEAAASSAYAAKAHAAAKAVYEKSIASGNFESTLIENIQHDFDKNFQAAGHTHTSEPTPSAPPTPPASEHTSAPDPVHADSETSVVKPLRDLFTMEYEPEDDEKNNTETGGWQSRG